MEVDCVAPLNMRVVRPLLLQEPQLFQGSYPAVATPISGICIPVMTRSSPHSITTGYFTLGFRCIAQ